MPYFPFVQLEFTHSIGPPPGRYIIHPRDRNGSESFAADGGEVASLGSDDDASIRLMGTADVLVIQVRGGSPPSPRRFRASMPKPPAGERPAEVSVTVVTVVIATRMMRAEAEAERLLSKLKSESQDQMRLLEVALGLLRRGVSAYRVAAADPYVPDVSGLDARAARIGYGEATAVVRGGWTDAFGVRLPKPTKVDRTKRLMPVQAMTAMLNGSLNALEAEELILSVLRDLDHERYRGAAVTLAGAQELLLAELSGEELPAKVFTLMTKLEGERESMRAIASRAVLDQLSKRDVDLLREHAEDAGALIDAWRYVPLGFV